jgi:hypothetical protein
MREKLRDNPVKVTGGITGAITGLLVPLAEWAVSQVPEAVPGDVRTSAGVLATALAVLVGERVGKFAQGRFTEPKGALDEVIANLHGETNPNVTAYEKDKAAGGDHDAPDDGLDDPVALPDDA